MSASPAPTTTDGSCPATGGWHRLDPAELPAEGRVRTATGLHNPDFAAYAGAMHEMATAGMVPPGIPRP